MDRLSNRGPLRLLTLLVAGAAAGLAPDAQAQTASSTATPQAAEPESVAPHPDHQDLPAQAPLQATSEPSLRGVSWTVMTGQVPEDGAIVQFEMGFSGLPRAAYHHSIGNGLSIGAQVAFDYARNRPDRAFDPAVIIAPTVRYRIPYDSIDIGARAAMGMRLPGQAGRDFAFTLDLEANMGFLVEHRFIVGGGIAMPIAFGLGNLRSVLDWPILIGPFAEYHIIPPVALTLDVKAGPHLTSFGNSGFGLRALFGLAVRL